MSAAVQTKWRTFQIISIYVYLLSTEEGLLGSESYTVWTIVCPG